MLRRFDAMRTALSGWSADSIAAGPNAEGGSPRTLPTSPRFGPFVLAGACAELNLAVNGERHLRRDPVSRSRAYRECSHGRVAWVRSNRRDPTPPHAPSGGRWVQR